MLKKEMDEFKRVYKKIEVMEKMMENLNFTMQTLLMQEQLRHHEIVTIKHRFDNHIQKIKVKYNEYCKKHKKQIKWAKENGRH